MEKKIKQYNPWEIKYKNLVKDDEGVEGMDKYFSGEKLYGMISLQKKLWNG